MAKLHLSWKRKINKQMTWGLMSKEFWPHPSAFPQARGGRQRIWRPGGGKGEQETEERLGPTARLPGRMRSQKPLQRWFPCWSPWNWSPDHNNPENRDTVSETCFTQARPAGLPRDTPTYTPTFISQTEWKISNIQTVQNPQVTLPLKSQWTYGQSCFI